MVLQGIKKSVEEKFLAAHGCRGDFFGFLDTLAASERHGAVLGAFLDHVRNEGLESFVTDAHRAVPVLCDALAHMNTSTSQRVRDAVARVDEEALKPLLTSLEWEAVLCIDALTKEENS